MGQHCFLWFSGQCLTRLYSGIGWNCGFIWGSGSSSNFVLLVGRIYFSCSCWAHHSLLLPGQQENLSDHWDGPCLCFKEPTWLGRLTRAVSFFIKSVTWLQTLIVSAQCLYLCYITYHNTVTGVLVTGPAFTKGRGLYKGMGLLAGLNCLYDPKSPMLKPWHPIWWYLEMVLGVDELMGASPSWQD